ncbi:MAG: GGDEF domain-containing protein [Spirochaetales bacterium]|nr:GGDEF domain-containing protein [Spirochaetales bacterium]
MGEYGDLSDQERRKLYRDFSRAAKEIRVDGPWRPGAGQAEGSKQNASDPDHRGERDAQQSAERFFFHRRRRKRPSYLIRLKIDSYAYSEEFEISGIGQFLTTLFSFLWPNRDPVPARFLKTLVLDSPNRGDPEGYGLTRTILELQKLSENLLKGGAFLRRDSDTSFNLKGDLTRDLLNWEPAVYRLMSSFKKIPTRLLEALDALRGRVEQQKIVHVPDLTDVVKGVYRITAAVQADPQVLEERIRSAGELIKGPYKRIYLSEEKIEQVCTRIDHQISDFLACYSRLKWFAGQLYPALLKMLNVFRPQAEVAAILDKIYTFAGLETGDVLILRGAEDVGRQDGGPFRIRERQDGQEQEAGGEDEDEPEELEEPPFDFNQEFRGILTILDYAFPGCRAQHIGEGDYSILLWFQQKIFSHRDYRGPVVARRLDFTDLLWKISRHDPLAPVIVLHELIAQMLESLHPEALVELLDPLGGRKPGSLDSFSRILRQWRATREEVLMRYLKEVDYFEKELSLRDKGGESRFLNSSIARKTIETINQIRNHIIRGYGHVALSMDRREYFRCHALYTLTRQLSEFLSGLVIRRDQLDAGSPIVRQRFDRDDLVERQPGPVMKQIHSYIEALPEDRRILETPRGEYNRVFLEILSAFTEILDFLLNDVRSRLREAGAEVFFASAEERRIYKEIEDDQTPLRVDLRKDFEEIDRLTGLFSKNEYLRFMPAAFQSSRQAGHPLSLMVMDLDRFKAINDTLGHDFGDEILKLAASVILSSGREEDAAVRFGGDELLVLVKGDAAAALGQAARIRSRYLELLKERFAGQLKEVPLLMAQKELAEKKKTDPMYHGGIEDFLDRWKGRGVGTLSIGVAQGLGKKIKAPCADEKELFRRADKILYLAKDSGGNRAVAMFDVLEIPLTAEEYADFLQYLEHIPAGDRADSARRYVDLRLANDQPPLFWNYPYPKYLQDS